MFGDFKSSKISEIEGKILKYWQENKIFEKSVSRKAKKDYVFYDGPPFATGLPHYGHLLASIIKDAIPRYQTMKGFRVERKWGWDCHGLPVENIVEQQLGLKAKKDIEKYGVEDFNEAARREVMKFVDDWKTIIPRIGRWVDMENPYKTMDADYTESVWWVFKTLFDKKLIYEGYKSMHICPRCETTLSNFEVALGYKDIEDSSVIVKFELEGQKNTYLLAWTTTPWTLPGNVALAINPKIQYVEVEGQVADNTYILAQSRVESVFGKEYKIIRSINSHNLVGKKYKPLFDYYSKECHSTKNIKNGPPATLSRSECGQGWKMYSADFVKTDEGTGIVHIAPAFGADDMALGKKHKLPFIQHVGMDGQFKKEVKDFAGLQAKPKNNPQETDQKIIALLEKQGKLLKSEKITHSYPHCWRCDTPLLNYAASSWFVDVTAVKNKKAGLINNNKKINWIPEHLKEGRFGKILEDAPDWAISRTRYWGAPLPVWKCEKCHSRKIIGSIEEFKKNSKQSGNNYFLMRHGESLANVKNVSSASIKTGRRHPLTLKGKNEVLEAAKQLKNKKIDLIFSSDILRAKETSEVLAQAMGLSRKKIIFDKRLREVDTGVFDGKNVENYRRYAALIDKFRVAPSKGENLAELKNRLMDFLYEVDRKYKDKNILIVSHEYPIWLMIAGAVGADAKKAVAMKENEECRHRRGEYLCPGEVMRLDFVPLPHNRNYELDLHRPYIDQVEFPCHCGGKMKREVYVFDCWFESGAMPYGQAHYPFENKEKFEKNFPAEFIAEGVDQTRGWFYTLLVLSTALFQKPAYKNVIVNGIILAEDGQKMSKRLKNYPDPMEVVAKYGADALRYYLLSSSVVRAEDLNFSEKGVDEIYKKLILRLANVQSFYEMYAGGKAADSKKQAVSKNILDQWILARLESLAAEVKKAMDAYELDKAARPLADFIDDLSTWYIRRSRERFRAGGKDKAEAVATTKYIFQEFAKITAPFTPFVAEWLNFKSDGKTSVHLEKWPEIEKSKIKNQKSKILLEQMKEVRRLASLGLEAREKAGIRVRQPLGKLKISARGGPASGGKNQESTIKNNKELLKILAEEINVKEIIFDSKIGDEIELDIAITPELRAEGILRDMTRLVQGLRQEAEYTPQDKISLWLELPKELEWPISRKLADFKKKIGAKTIEFKRTDKFDAETETNIDGKKIWAAIKKLK